MSQNKEDVKNEISNKGSNILYSNTIQEMTQDNHDKGLQILKFLKPYVAKLLLHMILIYISIQAYNEYIDSSKTYQSFRETLNKEVISDVKLINYNQNCPNEYTDLNYTIFPKIKKGCRCDFQIFSSDICDIINRDFNNDREQMKIKENNCLSLDSKIKRPLKNFRILDDFKNTNKTNEFYYKYDLEKKNISISDKLINYLTKDQLLNEKNSNIKKTLSQKYEFNISSN